MEKSNQVLRVEEWIKQILADMDEMDEDRKAMEQRFDEKWLGYRPSKDSNPKWP